MRAWTLGYPPAYERSVRIPGNAKAPGGYVFRTQKAAIRYAAKHEEASRYAPYEIMLDDYRQSVTRDYAVAATARHRWHTSTKAAGKSAARFMLACGVCYPRIMVLDCDLLTVSAPFINPDTGKPA